MGLYQINTFLFLSVFQMLLAATLHCWGLHSLGTVFCPSLAEDLLLDLHLMCIFPNIAIPFHHGIPWMHSS